MRQDGSILDKHMEISKAEDDATVNSWLQKHGSVLILLTSLPEVDVAEIQRRLGPTGSR